MESHFTKRAMITGQSLYESQRNQESRRAGGYPAFHELSPYDQGRWDGRAAECRPPGSPPCAPNSTSSIGKSSWPKLNNRAHAAPARGAAPTDFAILHASPRARAPSRLQCPMAPDFILRQARAAGVDPAGTRRLTFKTTWEGLRWAGIAECARETALDHGVELTRCDRVRVGWLREEVRVEARGAESGVWRFLRSMAESFAHYENSDA